MTNSPFRLEGHTLYHHDAPFVLKLSDFIADYDPTEHNCCKIPVDLSSEISLDFSLPEQAARKITSQGGFVIWDLYIDLPSKLSQMRFEGLFNLHFHSLQVFSEKLYELFKESTVACSLYQGSIEVERIFPWTEGDMIEFQEWLEDYYQTPQSLFETKENALGDIKTFADLDCHNLDITPFSRHLRNVYTMNLFMSYMHRLAAALKEELIVCVSLDTLSNRHLGFLTQLLSKERFSHIHLLLDQARGSVDGVLNHPYAQDVKIGVCFPNDPQCKLSFLNVFKNLLTTLQERKIDYKIIPEFLMTSSWDGLDYMIFCKHALSPQGKRMLQGFVAAGGACVFMDEPLGLETEVSLEELFKEV
jgi:hypothetical protein